MAATIKGTTIYLTRGDTLKIKVTMTKVGEEYVPIYDDSIRFAMKKHINDANPVLVKDISPETMILKLEPEDTKELDFGSYKYDIEYTGSDGTVDTFIGPATFVLTEEVY